MKTNDYAETLALVERAKVDQEAFVQLYHQYLPLIIHQACQFHRRDFDMEDWKQEGQIALWKAVMRYDGSSGSKFAAYFKLVLTTHFRSLIRYYLARKRQGETKALLMADVPLDHYVFGQDERAVENGILMEVEIPEYFQSLSASESKAVAHALLPNMVMEGNRRSAERAKAKLGIYLSTIA